jgi:hypothetical protein
LAEQLIRGHGFKTAHQVMSFIAAWAICCEALGRAPESVDEYSDWWRQSRATGFREQQLFRQVMAPMLTPTVFWESTRSTYSELFAKKNVVKVAAAIGFAS